MTRIKTFTTMKEKIEDINEENLIKPSNNSFKLALGFSIIAIIASISLYPFIVFIVYVLAFLFSLLGVIYTIDSHIKRKIIPTYIQIILAINIIFFIVVTLFLLASLINPIEC
jgi:hypothetical protein